MLKVGDILLHRYLGVVEIVRLCPKDEPKSKYWGIKLFEVRSLLSKDPLKINPIYKRNIDDLYGFANDSDIQDALLTAMLTFDLGNGLEIAFNVSQKEVFIGDTHLSYDQLNNLKKVLKKV